MSDFNPLELLYFALPSLVVGAVAFYFFKLHVNNEEQRRRFLLRRENQKSALPLRLQAYERMALFLERISLGNLLIRVKPNNNSKQDYENLLIQTIDQEFDHNLSQQIYLSTECWNVIKTSKNATIGIIRKTARQEDIGTADKLREVILTNLMQQTPPTEASLEFVKKEVKNLI
jgi:hypothetical protein